ncbi:4Fe-4S dicluster domain-containing protein [Candidatus Berkiella aquae]|uniref:Electron transfer flavoprotein-ubiquinone oxidoreductase n=1 Tax=Candidatus Berkiella aquae TaxID=295108 RepID=A0A0Q9Z018_9GAMM|nr:electron transfer flavoprotein-ubiquinone oxidoreductase [Candidatus Berkiella aquae]MCS5712424.1 electron transfer flavoprotein-ubiquinone oxidoreductase [Candidatus Berkiella aquae]
MTQESMEYDVVIVGAGPAGLACAIRYAQLCKDSNQQPKICLLEKGAEVGAHILSGAVFEPRALNELLPDWQQQGAPLHTQVTQDEFLWLSASKAFRLPTPPQMHNHGHYIISLGLLCRWLAKQAESLGVEIYPGFAASTLLYNQQGEVIGVSTNDVGRDKQGNPTSHFQAGMHLLAKKTVFAEGCRGSLTQQLIKRFDLAKNSQPQTYAIGIKEIWEIKSEKHRTGTVTHTVGWPLDQSTYGGSFLYHWGNNLLSIGLVIGLDYQNPYLNPYEEFQRFKHHPHIAPLLENAQCQSYGARALNEGGWQSIPQLTFPGGLLIGDAAGFMNVPKIKGSHTAMKSGMLAAQALFSNTDYEQQLKQSWIKNDLYPVRNIRPAFRMGLFAGLTYAAVDTYLLRGKAPWTLSHRADYTYLKPAKAYQPIIYPKPDGKISFDKMTSLARSNVFHEENQPVHLKLSDPTVPVKINWQQYAGPEARYCPAGVYEFIDDANGNKKLQINAQNCIHCKTCDIKDPTQNITWEAPEGGGGPNYSNM